MRFTNILKIPLVALLLAFAILSGCAKENAPEKARADVQKSEAYYRSALGLYAKMIAEGKDLNRMHLELGQLYYNHGDFKQAIEELQKTQDVQAKKFLAIARYLLGDFTEALEVFSKNENNDDEYNYYYGRTCEKLNLFDRALAIYKKLKSKDYAALGLERINIIEKQANQLHIKDIDPKTYAIIKNSPTQEEYPQAGALILFCDERIEVTPENTEVSYLHYVVKILNERGKEEFAETHIDYDSTEERVDLEYARTIKPDGEVVDVGSRHIRDVSKYMNFPLYSNARVYIISFPEITEGAVVEYKLKVLRNQLINKKDFILAYPVQSSQPIIYANFTLSLAEGKNPLLKVLNEKYNNFGANLNPVIEKNSGKVSYRWEFKNIPQVVPESNMPPNVEINPTLVISTFASWQEVYNWWWSLAKGKIEANLTIKDKVKQLLEGQSTEKEKISAIYNFCAREIRYVAVEYGQAGYEPHKAEDIFKNKYGDCKDQAILLVTMLKEAGFSAWPVLISTRDYYNLNPDLASVLFNHCIAAVSVSGGFVFLDPTAETCSFGDLPSADQNRKVLLFKDSGYAIEETPLYPAGNNLIRQYLRLAIKADDSINAQKDIFTGGVYAQAERYWLLYTPPELIRQALEEKIQGVSIGAHLDKYEVKHADELNQPVTLSYNFSGQDFLTAAGNLRIMPQLSELDASLVAKDTRRYPIAFDILDTKETIIDIAIPHNLAVKYIPVNIGVENSWLKFNAGYEQKDSTLYFKQKIELKKNEISREEYADFKAMYTGLAKKIKQRVVLEEVK